VKRSVDAFVERAKSEALAKAASLRFGPVVSVGAGSVNVTLDGVEVGPVPVINGVSALVDDQAWMLQQGSLLVCIGTSTP